MGTCSAKQLRVAEHTTEKGAVAVVAQHRNLWEPMQTNIHNLIESGLIDLSSANDLPYWQGCFVGFSASFIGDTRCYYNFGNGQVFTNDEMCQATGMERIFWYVTDQYTGMLYLGSNLTHLMTRVTDKLTFEFMGEFGIEAIDYATEHAQDIMEKLSIPELPRVYLLTLERNLKLRFQKIVNAQTRPVWALKTYLN